MYIFVECKNHVISYICVNFEDRQHVYSNYAVAKNLFYNHIITALPFYQLSGDFIMFN